MRRGASRARRDRGAKVPILLQRFHERGGHVGGQRCARRAAETSGAIVVFKGPDTVVAHPDGRASVAANAPPWLATAGSGDVLAGLIAGLAARGTPPEQAAVWGVALHAAAGRAFAARLGAVGFLARELNDVVPALMHGYAAPPR